MIMKTSDRLVIEKTGTGGFTLIELAVVVATIAVLVAVLLPALAGTKPNTQAFQCLENQRRLILAWQMYAQDNNDILPPNDYPYTTAVAQDGIVKNWVFGTMYKILDAINASILVDPRLTCLALYNTNPAVYKCPADISLLQGHQRVRSVSMNSAVGTVWWSDSSHNGTKKPGSAVGGGWLPGNYNDSQTTYRTYGKITQMTKPGPSSTWVIADENPNTINDGSLAVCMDGSGPEGHIVDFPANYHGNACGLAFADGHAEMHKWVDVFTMLIPTPNMTIALPEVGSQVSAFMSGSSRDLAWIQPRTSALR